jgi:hypothetical protein
MTNLLIDERPMMVLPSLANRIGLDNAVVLQQINYWIRLHEQSDNERSFHEGRWWVFNTIEEWQAKQFTWWSVETVKRIIATLEKMGLVISDTFNVKACDRKKWYTIDYDAVDRLKSMNICCVGNSRTDLIELVKNPETIENSHKVNLTQGSASGQSDPMEKVNLTQFNGSNRPNDLYKEITQQTTSETTLYCAEGENDNRSQDEVPTGHVDFLHPLGSDSSSSRRESQKARHEKEFEELVWKIAYKKVGKEPALKAYLKLRKETARTEEQRDDVLEAWRYANEVMFPAQHKEKGTKQFIPLASTWFNGKRWNDEDVQEGLHNRFVTGQDSPPASDPKIHKLQQSMAQSARVYQMVMGGVA